MKFSESLKKNHQFQFVYKNGKSYANKYLVMYVKENGLMTVNDEGELRKTIEEVIESIKKNSRNFAKRQYTWFKNQMDVHWYDIMDKTFKENVFKDVEYFLKGETHEN